MTLKKIFLETNLQSEGFGMSSQNGREIPSFACPRHAERLALYIEPNHSPSY